jgi:hypothetical protein
MALFDLWRRRLEPPLAGYAALQRLGTFFRECGGMRSEDLGPNGLFHQLSI